MNSWFEDYERERKERLAKTIEDRAELITKLREAGITNVEVTFNGCGDSGSIDEVTITPSNDDLREDIENWCYDFLDGTGIDWYDNDGGYGEIIFDLTEDPGKFIYEINQNYTASNCVGEGEETI